MKKKVIICGASGALGKAVAEAFLGKDYDEFFLLGSSVDKNLSSEKVKVINTGDLSLEQNAEDAFSKINVSPEDRLFLYSAIGGFWAGESLQDTSSDDWDRMFNKNLKSNFIIAKKYINLAEKCRGGGVCFTSAMSGINPTAMRIAYGASKSALNYLVKALAEECEPKGISVTGIAPYVIDTADNRTWLNHADIEKAQKPAEIAELIHFIFTGSHYLSGNIILLRNRIV